MRRLRLLLAAAAIALIAMLGLAHPASAEGKFKDHASEECAKKLETGGVVEDCMKSPNPLLPEWNEILWGVVGFAVVFGAIAWKGYPGIKKGMDARTERIKGDLDAAEAERTEAEQVLAQYQAQLNDSRSEAARIVEEARQAADEVKANLVAKAEADVADMRQRAGSEIEAAKVQAIADLRGEVTALAIGAAEQVVERNLDTEANRALVESYIDSVGASR